MAEEKYKLRVPNCNVPDEIRDTFAKLIYYGAYKGGETDTVIVHVDTNRVITADVKQDGIDHNLIHNRGVNTHYQIDDDLARLADTSGTNTGDQDLTPYATKTYADTAAQQAENNAKSYADTVAQTAENNAKSYADGLVVPDYGDTASRPSSDLQIGQSYFDTDLGKPIWYDGSGWVDATGTSV